MSTAWVDSSCLVARMFGEPAGAAIAKRLGDFADICASALLEAELRSAAAREQVHLDDDLLAPLHWIHPSRRLEAELERVFRAGYVRGADAWHLACALYFFESPEGATFLTLDASQRAVAEALGFKV